MMMIATKIKQFFSKLRCVGLKVPRESDKGSDLETGYPGDPETSSDFEYLQARRRWSRILVPSETEGSSYYGGTALMLLVSQRKSDLQICGLPCCHNKVPKQLAYCLPMIDLSCDVHRVNERVLLLRIHGQ
ncbi:hypothetical protein KQX54_017243 [Cotesia glomerata]|uniref:Uncharacterized protein n=1 Tax=Cotesia glomerata TaxID=32391 RepID=A0AAV7IAM0_COTGL|nr:hypothetical protein KQX54_017243 [Cotesia glomerata]